MATLFDFDGGTTVRDVYDQDIIRVKALKTDGDEADPNDYVVFHGTPAQLTAKIAELDARIATLQAQRAEFAELETDLATWASANPKGENTPRPENAEAQFLERDPKIQ